MRDMQTAGGAQVTGVKRHRAAIRLFAGLTIGIVAVDLLSKVLVVATLIDHPPVKLFGGLLYLVHTRNTGAAFSMASGYTVVLSVIALVVAAVIVRVARRLASYRWAVALGLILGGAFGNLIDRIFRSPGPLRGGVVDFLSLIDPIDPPWPVFNVADSALVIGVALAVGLELFGVGLGTAKSNPVSVANEDNATPPSAVK